MRSCQRENYALIVRLVDGNTRLVEVRQSRRGISNTQSAAALVHHQGVPQGVPPDARNDCSESLHAMRDLLGERLRLVLKAP